MPRTSRERTLTTADLVVLSFLMERPMHGYQIVLGLKTRRVQDWAGVSKPQVYYSLKKLETAGLIQGECANDLSLGPERRVFSISPQAISALKEALGSEAWAMNRQVPLFFHMGHAFDLRGPVHGQACDRSSQSLPGPGNHPRKADTERGQSRGGRDLTVCCFAHRPCHPEF